MKVMFIATGVVYDCEVLEDGMWRLTLNGKEVGDVHRYRNSITRL